MMQFDTNKPCKATFHVSCVISLPLKNDKWAIGGTYNDGFTCDLVSNVDDVGELSIEVRNIVEMLKKRLKNVVTLENILNQSINEGNIDVKE